LILDSGKAPREGTCYGDPKPPARIVDKNAGREKVAREGRCRVTGKPFPTRFHLVGKDLGGDDIDANIVPVHWEVHHMWEHVRGGKKLYGPAIWNALFEWEKDYVLEKKGVDFVRRYYSVCLLCNSTVVNEGAHAERCCG